MSMDPGVLVRLTLTRREKTLVLAALAAVVALAWGYLVVSATRMDISSITHGAMHMMPAPWATGHFVLMALMWAVMMIAMMLPSAAPMVLTYAAVAQKIAPQQKQTAATALFVSGYVLTWSSFSLGATGLQWGLESAALVSPAMVASSNLLGGILLIVAGLYQLSPLKAMCLRFCQSPLAFVAQHWRAGPAGALGMGLKHGMYCVGCCWGLMLLLFVGGVMNLLWVAAISVFVLTEKLIGAGTRAGRWISGGGLIGAGVLLIAHGS